MKYDLLHQSLLEELEKSLGIITPACKAVGIDRKTFNDWTKKYPKFKEAVDSILESQGDFVENKLLKLIRDENPSATIFYCKTKLKDRGYREGQDISITGTPTALGVNMDELAKAALEAMQRKEAEE